MRVLLTATGMLTNNVTLISFAKILEDEGHSVTVVTIDFLAYELRDLTDTVAYFYLEPLAKYCARHNEILSNIFLRINYSKEVLEMFSSEQYDLCIAHDELSFWGARKLSKKVGARLLYNQLYPAENRGYRVKFDFFNLLKRRNRKLINNSMMNEGGRLELSKLTEKLAKFENASIDMVIKSINEIKNSIRNDVDSNKIVSLL